MIRKELTTFTPKTKPKLWICGPNSRNQKMHRNALTRWRERTSWPEPQIAATSVVRKYAVFMKWYVEKATYFRYLRWFKFPKAIGRRRGTFRLKRRPTKLNTLFRRYRVFVRFRTDEMRFTDASDQYSFPSFIGKKWTHHKPHVRQLPLQPNSWAYKGLLMSVYNKGLFKWLLKRRSGINHYSVRRMLKFWLINDNVTFLDPQVSPLSAQIPTSIKKFLPTRAVTPESYPVPGWTSSFIAHKPEFEQWRVQTTATYGLRNAPFLKREWPSPGWNTFQFRKEAGAKYLIMLSYELALYASIHWPVSEKTAQAKCINELESGSVGRRSARILRRLVKSIGGETHDRTFARLRANKTLSLTPVIRTPFNTFMPAHAFSTGRVIQKESLRLDRPTKTTTKVKLTHRQRLCRVLSARKKQWHRRCFTLTKHRAVVDRARQFATKKRFQISTQMSHFTASTAPRRHFYRYWTALLSHYKEKKTYIGFKLPPTLKKATRQKYHAGRRRYLRLVAAASKSQRNFVSRPTPFYCRIGQNWAAGGVYFAPRPYYARRITWRKYCWQKLHLRGADQPKHNNRLFALSRYRLPTPATPRPQPTAFYGPVALATDLLQQALEQRLYSRGLEDVMARQRRNRRYYVYKTAKWLLRRRKMHRKWRVRRPRSYSWSAHRLKLFVPRRRRYRIRRIRKQYKSANLSTLTNPSAPQSLPPVLHAFRSGFTPAHFYRPNMLGQYTASGRRALTAIEKANRSRQYYHGLRLITATTYLIPQILGRLLGRLKAQSRTNLGGATVNSHAVKLQLKQIYFSLRQYLHKRLRRRINSTPLAGDIVKELRTDLQYIQTALPLDKPSIREARRQLQRLYTPQRSIVRGRRRWIRRFFPLRYALYVENPVRFRRLLVPAKIIRSARFAPNSQRQITLKQEHTRTSERLGHYLTHRFRRTDSRRFVHLLITGTRKQLQGTQTRLHGAHASVNFFARNFSTGFTNNHTQRLQLLATQVRLRRRRLFPRGDDEDADEEESSIADNKKESLATFSPYERAVAWKNIQASNFSQLKWGAATETGIPARLGDLRTSLARAKSVRNQQYLRRLLGLKTATATVPRLRAESVRPVPEVLKILRNWGWMLRYSTAATAATNAPGSINTVPHRRFRKFARQALPAPRVIYGDFENFHRQSVQRQGLSKASPIVSYHHALRYWPALSTATAQPHQIAVISALLKRKDAAETKLMWPGRRQQVWDFLSSHHWRTRRYAKRWLARRRRILKFERWQSCGRLYFKDLRKRLRKLIWKEPDDYNPFEREDYRYAFRFRAHERRRGRWLEALMYRRAIYSTRTHTFIHKLEDDTWYTHYRRHQIPREQKRLKWVQRYRQAVFHRERHRRFIKRRRWHQLRIYNRRLFLRFYNFRSIRAAQKHFKKLSRLTPKQHGFSRALVGLGNRFDINLVLLNIVPTIYWARILAPVGLLRVNTKIIYDPNYMLQPGDVVQWETKMINRFQHYFQRYYFYARKKYFVAPSRGALYLPKPRRLRKRFGPARSDVSLRRRTSGAIPGNFDYYHKLRLAVYRRLPELRDLRKGSRFHRVMMFLFRMEAGTGL